MKSKVLELWKLNLRFLGRSPGVATVIRTVIRKTQVLVKETTRTGKIDRSPVRSHCRNRSRPSQQTTRTGNTERRMHVCIHIYIYIYTCIHIYIYIWALGPWALQSRLPVSGRPLFGPVRGPVGLWGRPFVVNTCIGRVNAPLNAGLWVADGPRHHTPVKGNWRSVAGNTGAPSIHDAAIANFATSPSRRDGNSVFTSH